MGLFFKLKLKFEDGDSRAKLPSVVTSKVAVVGMKFPGAFSDNQLAGST